MQEELKQSLDIVAVSATASTLLGWLPPMAALATLVWTGIRIYETETIQKLLKRDD